MFLPIARLVDVGGQTHHVPMSRIVSIRNGSEPGVAVLLLDGPDPYAPDEQGIERPPYEVHVLAEEERSLEGATVQRPAENPADAIAAILAQVALGWEAERQRIRTTSAARAAHKLQNPGVVGVG